MGTGTLSYIQRQAPVQGTAKAMLKARQEQKISGVGVSRDVGFELHVNTSGGRTYSFGM